MKSDKEEWMKVFYEECWRQYSHEDILFNKRNTLFITINGLFISVLGTITVIIGNGIFTQSKESFIYSSVIVVLSVLSIKLLKNWKGVANAGHNFVRMRKSNAKKIEEQIKTEGFGLAEFEDEIALAENESYIGGIKSTREIIKVLSIFWKLILSVGAIGLVIWLVGMIGKLCAILNVC